MHPFPAVNFHSSGSLILTGGTDKILRVFKVDGESNEKQLSKYICVSITSSVVISIICIILLFLLLLLQYSCIVNMYV